MSSRKQRNSRTVGALLAAAVPVASLLFAVGCDSPSHEADKKVAAKLEQARFEASVGDAKGRADFEAAAADSTAGPLARSFARSSLAQFELEAAAASMQAVDRDELKLYQLVYEISQLAQQVDASHSIAAGYSKYDPKPTHDAIAQKITDAQGSADKAEWFTQAGISMPSLAAVTTRIAALEGDLSKKKDEVKALEDQRTHTLDEAEQASKNADASKGRQSVGAFNQAAELRKKAGDLSVQIERGHADVVPLEKDLAVAKGQQGVLNDVIKQLQDENAALDANWQSLQTAVAAQSQLAQQIVGSGSATPAAAPAAAPASTGDAPAAGGTAKSLIPPTVAGTMAAKSAAMGELMKQIDAERADAEKELNNAVSKFTEAAKAAGEVYSQLDPKIKDPANATRAELSAWKNLQLLAHPAGFNLQVATANRQLAALHLAEVASISTRQQMVAQVNKALGAAGITVPSELVDSGLEEKKKTAAGLTADAYAEADKVLSNVSEGAAPQNLKDLAEAAQILTLYGESQLARFNGDKTASGEKLTAAIQKRDTVLQTGHVLLPALPAEFPAPAAPAAVVAPASPAATPAEPAAAPAAPAAPAN